MLAPNMATMLAVLTTDARCDPATLAGVAARRGGGQLQPDDRGRVHVDQRHRAGAGQRGQRPRRCPSSAGRRAGRSVRRAGRDDGGRRRGGQQGGARGRDGRGRRDDEAHRAGSQGGGVGARQVLAQRRGPVLGSGGERARIGRAWPSTWTGSRSPTAAWSVCRAGVAVEPRRGRRAAAHGRDRPSRCAATSAWGRAPGPCSPPTWATATSTRTGRHRDARSSARPSAPRCWSRPCPTSCASGERSSSSSTAATC